MPHIERHAPGAFCWIELATTDQNEAKRFYSSMFQWSVTDVPMGPGSVYSMFALEGRSVAAAFQIAEHDTGLLPNWMIYIAVDDADATAKRTETLKGVVLAPPFDVADLGRMAVLQDPTGATFSIWQPKAHTGTGIAGIDGTLCWADLRTPDRDKAGQFYGGLFNWHLILGQNENYLHIRNGSEFIGGIPDPGDNPPGLPAHWLPYFQTSHCDEMAKKAKGQGALLSQEPTSMEGVGRIAVVCDPQQATFALYQPPEKAA